MSEIITMSVNPTVTVSVTINSNPAGAICQGTPVTFTAYPTNSGSEPEYQWTLNGSPIAGAIENTYTSNTLNNGDQIRCIITSNANCASESSATSLPINMSVNPLLPVSISISASDNPVCSGASVVFTATPQNPGLNPLFNWLVNGNQTGSSNPVYQYVPANGDVVSCILTSSELCSTNNPATSNGITMTVHPVPQVTITPCNDLITITTAKPFRLKGGLPLGGVYFGSGVNLLTGKFDPATALLGNNVITYTYTNFNLCAASNVITIQVLPPPVFTCGDEMTDLRDGRTYPTFILPNGRCWMASNLSYGDSIIGSKHQTDNCISEKYCPEGIPVKCNQFGGMYQWDEIMRYESDESGQGLCPPGWHVASSADWDELLFFNSGASQAGTILKDSLLVNGFNALLGGIYYQNSIWSFYLSPTEGSMFWTSTLYSSQKAIARGLNRKNQSVSYYPANRNNAFSVRCVLD